MGLRQLHGIFPIFRQTSRISGREPVAEAKRPALPVAVWSASSEMSTPVAVAVWTWPAAPARSPLSPFRDRECGTLPRPGGGGTHEWQQRIDQRFGVRARLQRFGRKRQMQAVKFAKPENPVDRFAADSPRQRPLDGRRGVGRMIRSGVEMASARLVPEKCSTISRASSPASAIPALASAAREDASTSASDLGGCQSLPPALASSFD